MIHEDGDTTRSRQYEIYQISERELHSTLPSMRSGKNWNAGKILFIFLLKEFSERNFYLDY